MVGYCYHTLQRKHISTDFFNSTKKHKDSNLWSKHTLCSSRCKEELKLERFENRHPKSKLRQFPCILQENLIVLQLNHKVYDLIHRNRLVSVYCGLQPIQQDYRIRVRSGQRSLRTEFMQFIPTPNAGHDKFSLSTPICDSLLVEPYASTQRWHPYPAHPKWASGSSTDWILSTRRSLCRTTWSWKVR